MKKPQAICVGVVFVLGFAFILHAQNASPALSPGNTANAPLPIATPYAVTARDANNNVWERTTYERSPDGQIVPRKHSYTELATGLNYLKDGQWTESKEKIDVLPQGGAAATQGQHQAYFPADIYQGQIELVTPDGQHLKSRPMGISYDDGTKTVLIAQLKDSVGELVGSNQVVYSDTFTDFKADLVCTYRKSGFECDLVFREQPPSPENYGLSSQSARLQLLTEFFDTPEPKQTSAAVSRRDGLSDTTLQFGSTVMGHGKAFAVSGTAPSAKMPVYKSWIHVDGRTFLVEELPYQKIEPALQSLPVPASASAATVSMNSPLHKVSASRLLIPSWMVQKTGTNVIQLAKIDLNRKPGVVLDYVTMNSDKDNFTFQGDTTYYISGMVNLNGTTTLEGGTVIKIPQSASGQLLSVGGHWIAKRNRIGWQYSRPKTIIQ